MTAMMTELAGVFGDVLAKFAEAPLSYVVGLAIVAACVGMVAALFGTGGGGKRGRR